MRLSKESGLAESLSCQVRCTINYVPPWDFHLSLQAEDSVVQKHRGMCLKSAPLLEENDV